MSSTGLAIIVAFLGASGAFFGFFQFMINRKDNTEDINKHLDAIDKKFDDLQECITSITTKVGQIEDSLNGHIVTEERADMNSVRQRVIRFSDEIYRGHGHTREHYDNVLTDIDRYEKYCDLHPEYENNVAVNSIIYIKESYQKSLENHLFLGEKEE